MIQKIAKCSVEIGSHWVKTTFPDGVTLDAYPNYDDESKARAKALGYSGDPVHAVDAMTCDHDVIHSMLAEARGQDYSPALWAAAHGEGCETGDDEERIVFLVQRLVNEGLDF